MKQISFSSQAIEYIKTNNLIGIKAGLDRPDFLDIWMVVVDNRIFARSWGFAERSWYNTFMKNPEGQIKCGERIFHIQATIPKDNSDMTERINHAYLAKYNSDHNIKYAIGIIEDKHVEKTMEFIVCEEVL
jgi:hypothetical protein